MSEELKPCPFCGNPPRTKEWLERGHLIALRVWCDECTVCPSVQTTKDHAIEKWNYRPEEDDLRRQLDEKDEEIRILKDALTTERKVGDIIYNNDEYLVVDIGGCQMTAPRGSLEWQMRYGDPVRVRMVAAAALNSYEYLVLYCTKEEAWRRIKLIRKAMKEFPDAND